VSDVPSYSDEARDVLELFYLEYVDAVFYFEDSNHESVYERLLRRLMPDLKPFAVVCLGGKTKVIAKAKEVRPRGIRRLFVLDKDYDDLLGSMVTIDSTYYLRMFSIENYLASLHPLLQVAVEVDAQRLTLAQAEAKCGSFDAYFVRLSHRLEKLSRLFVVARRFRVDIETTKASVDGLLEGADPDNPMPTEEWIAAYRTRLQSRAHGANEWLANDDALDAVLGSAFDRDEALDFPVIEARGHLCGKHLLGCMLRYVQKAVEASILKIDTVELYLRIVGHAQLDRLNYLRDAILGDHPDIVRA
jgi:hypothetical protein